MSFLRFCFSLPILAFLGQERLFHSALKLFDDGEAWERGITLAEELRTYYQQTYQVPPRRFLLSVLFLSVMSCMLFRRVLQYDRLAELLRTQAGFFAKIVHNERCGFGITIFAS